MGGATVTFRDTATDNEYVFTADENGVVSQYLTTGYYEVTAEKSAYSGVTVAGLLYRNSITTNVYLSTGTSSAESISSATLLLPLSWLTLACATVLTTLWQ